MSGGKETGRQKMIGMMYLVLTALLAMNISKDVLLAFVTVEEGLNETNRNFDAKNASNYTLFDIEFDNDSTKAGPLREKALRLRASADSLCDYINSCRGSFVHLAMKGNIDGTEGLITRDSADTHPLSETEGTDNYDTPTMTLIGSDILNPTGMTVELKQKIVAYKKLCYEIVETVCLPDTSFSAVDSSMIIKPFDSVKYEGFKMGLNTDDVFDKHMEKDVSWEVSNYYHTTIAAAAALLAGIKNEVKTAESDVVKLLLNEITGDIVRFDEVVAKVVAPSSYILAGEKYKADLFVAAYSTTVDPVVKVDGYGGEIEIEGGMGKYIVPTGAPGEKKYKGTIDVKQPDGTFKSYPFESKYMVAKPSMAVSPTKMNVFYIGVNNPVEISVAGASPTQVKASLTGATGSIRPVPGKPGQYIVKVKKGNKCKVNVSISIDGKTKSMGFKEFRVRRVPSPQASFAGVIGDGKVTKGQIRAAAGVIPKLEDFVFDLKFPVVSWTMSMNVNGVFVDMKAKGPARTSEMKALLGKAKSGSKVLIEQVKVKAPDGKIRKIVGCVIKIK